MIIEQITVSFSLSQEKHYAFVQSNELERPVIATVFPNVKIS
jgi:hypothetical protein